MTDTAGALLARYAFDPWGRRTVTAGTDVTTVGFTGHRTHTSSGLALALYRGCDAGLARWVGEDPLGYTAGIHLDAYVDNAPVLSVDPLGLTKGGRQNIGVTHKGQQLTTRSSAETVKQAVREVVRGGMGGKHVKALKGLLRVIKRGGTMGVACLLMDCDEYTDVMDCLVNPQPDCFPTWKPPVCEM